MTHPVTLALSDLNPSSAMKWNLCKNVSKFYITLAFPGALVFISNRLLSNSSWMCNQHHKTIWGQVSRPSSFIVATGMAVRPDVQVWALGSIAVYFFTWHIQVIGGSGQLCIEHIPISAPCPESTCKNVDMNKRFSYLNFSSIFSQNLE